MNELALPRTFMKLRNAAFLGQLLLFLLAHTVFSLTLPVLTLSILIALIPLSNALYYLLLPYVRDTRKLTAVILCFDTLLLTALLYCSGGPTNPFSIMYLVQVVLAALLLDARWTVLSTILSIAGFSFLFYDSIPIPEWSHHGAHHGFSLHLHGMLFSYIIVSSIMAYFLSSLLNALKDKERRVQQLETRANNEKRLAALTTAAAGAAHELGTPLATIAVVAHELARELSSRSEDAALQEDCAILKEEVARCKAILKNLSTESGTLMGEQPEDARLTDILKAACNPLQAEKALVVSCPEYITLTKVPVEALTRAFRSLIKNALEAGGTEAVQVLCSYTNETVSIEIHDKGCGMNESTLHQLGEAFYSTRTASVGMGLGVYLSKLTIEQLQGSITFQSGIGEGTRVSVSLPQTGYLSKAA